MYPNSMFVAVGTHDPLHLIFLDSAVEPGFQLQISWISRFFCSRNRIHVGSDRLIFKPNAIVCSLVKQSLQYPFRLPVAFILKDIIEGVDPFLNLQFFNVSGASCNHVTHSRGSFRVMKASHSGGLFHAAVLILYCKYDRWLWPERL